MSDEKTPPIEDLTERSSILTDEPVKEEGEVRAESGDAPKPEDKAEAKSPPPPDYSTVKLPEGVELDPKQFDEAKAIAAEYKLAPEGFQKLVDKYISVNQAAAEAPYRLFKEMVTGWEDAVQKDPEIGGENFSKMRTTVAKAFDQFVPKESRKAFDQALVMTGAGSNPEIIRAFYRMSKELTEGGPVSGKPPGSIRPATLGEALGYTKPNGEAA